MTCQQPEIAAILLDRLVRMMHAWVTSLRDRLVGASAYSLSADEDDVRSDRRLRVSTMQPRAPAPGFVLHSKLLRFQPRIEALRSRSEASEPVVEANL